MSAADSVVVGACSASTVTKSNAAVANSSATPADGNEHQPPTGRSPR
jgi:hypothetical protein